MQSVGDFAESLILSEVRSVQSGEAKPPIMSGNKPSPDVPDISRVAVPKSFMSQILGESVEEEFVEPQEEVIEVEETHPNYITEETASELITLLRDVKAMFSEMTSTGMIGVHFGKSTYKKPTGKDKLKSKLEKIRSRRK